MLEAPDLKLRNLTLSDLDFLLALENDKSLWSVSDTNEKFTRQQIKQYIENSHKDIKIAGQFRYLIEFNDTPIGCADLHNYSKYFNTAEIGIVIIKDFRKRGLAKKALKLLIFHAFYTLNIHQLKAIITKDNISSISLFTSLNFTYQGNNIYFLNKL